MTSASILVSRSLRCSSRYPFLISFIPVRIGHKTRYYSTNESDDPLSTSIRSLMRASAQPVAVITTLISSRKDDNTSTISSLESHAHGATLSSFSTVSLDPPLLAFSLRTPSRMADALRANAQGDKANFVVNILSDKQEIEASGFSRGVKSFALSQDWDETVEKSYIDDQHPLSTAPFHPSQYAQSSQGIAVPVLSESIGALACSVISIISLRDPKKVSMSQVAALKSDRGSELFIAKIHGVEADSRQSKRLPMVYWNQQFKSVK